MGDRATSRSHPIGTVDGPEGRQLWERADRALPGGGIYLSRSADLAGRGVLPGFVAAAEGCRVVDADGREYIDLLCANGPNLLGYRHAEVEAAAARQRAKLTSASMFPPVLVELAERLTDRFRFDWAVLSKNGSEVVSLGARVARQHTGRSRLVTFAGAYHGNDPELAVSPPSGPLTERTRDVDRLPWNDADRLVDHCAAHADDIAAVVLNPVDQNPLRPTEWASAEFAAAVTDVQERHGIVLVLDDVRHGFRLHPDGSHRLLGVHPDLLVLGKGLGNGYAVSALLGREDLRRAARRIMYTSTYMFEAPPMAAALATLDVYDREGVFGHITDMGRRLRLGILDAAAETGHAVSYTGPDTMPTLLLVDDPGQGRLRHFAFEAARRGALLHPALNWNLSAAHTPADVDSVVDIVRASMIATPHAEESANA